MHTDPRDVWLSRNFRLSDFLGNHSVYAKGYANPYEGGQQHEDNARALCESALEPILERFGPVSLSYGYISPEFSRLTVKYQDPDKPSHHRWDLGAAADVCVHDWVEGRPLPQGPTAAQLLMHEDTSTSPVALAHELDESGLPYSRLITYSESPFVCVAVSAAEVAQSRPRRAFYENRYQGVAKVKPEYLQMSNAGARRRNHNYLQDVGLEHPWRGAGHPTYHGGGFRQYQHIRVSRYTTILDWLFNMKSISEGVKNPPMLMDERVQDSFAAAGIVYDWLIGVLGVPRLSILSGYLARTHPDFLDHPDWHTGEWVDIEVGAPQGMFVDGLEMDIAGLLPAGLDSSPTERGVCIGIPVAAVLGGLVPYAP